MRQVHPDHPLRKSGEIITPPPIQKAYPFTLGMRKACNCQPELRMINGFLGKSSVYNDARCLYIRFAFDVKTIKEQNQLSKVHCWCRCKKCDQVVCLSRTPR